MLPIIRWFTIFSPPAILALLIFPLSCYFVYLVWVSVITLWGCNLISKLSVFLVSPVKIIWENLFPLVQVFSLVRLFLMSWKLWNFCQLFLFSPKEWTKLVSVFFFNYLKHHSLIELINAYSFRQADMVDLLPVNHIMLLLVNTFLVLYQNKENKTMFSPSLSAKIFCATSIFDALFSFIMVWLYVR